MAVVVKNQNLKKIFHTMDYGDVNESTDSAKQWLAQKHEGIYTYVDQKENSSKGEAFNVDAIASLKPIITIYNVKECDVAEILSHIVQHNKWAFLKAINRAISMHKFASLIQSSSKLLCELEVLLRGILGKDTKSKALPLLVNYLQYYASWAVKYNKICKDWEPEKVAVGVIADDSFLAAFGFVLGPALAAGYSVILQTEPRITPIAALLVELAEAAGIPEGTIKLLPGVVNLRHILENENVGIVSSFGSLGSNKCIEKPLRVKFLAVTNSKIPMMVFNNADVNSSCNSVIDAAWGYRGILPWSVNVILVQEDIYQVFVDKLKDCLRKTVVCLTATSKMADISVPQQGDVYEELVRAVEKAKFQGIEVFQKDEANAAIQYQPTLLLGGKSFGTNVIVDDTNLPVVTIMAFRTTEEAVNLANNSRYGFGASVWTENIGLANEVAEKLNVSNVWINSHGLFTAETTMSLRKESGVGYFGGAAGFYEYVSIANFQTEEENRRSPSSSSSFDCRSISGFYDYKSGNALNNAFSSAKKGFEVWNKLTISARKQLLRNIAAELGSKKTYLCEFLKLIGDRGPEITVCSWISAIFEGETQGDDLGSVSRHKCYELKICQEAVGTVMFEECDIVSALRALLLGNSIIILNFDLNKSSLYLEFCKIFTSCGMPAGVFNVIANCKKDVFHDFVAQKELNVYVAATAYNLLNNIKVGNLKRVYCFGEVTCSNFAAMTHPKNVWSNVGDST